MAKRKIIRIDEDLCNGCGECVTACAEGALRIVGGKARLVKEEYCDGLGDCLGECPTSALTVEERDVAGYDAGAARAHVAQSGGEEAARLFDRAAERHAAPAGGCPGTRWRNSFGEAPAAAPAPSTGSAAAIPSELRQWPVHLGLIPPGAPFLRGRELVLMSACGPLASADVHWRFLRGRAVALACPKLDRAEGYVEKLAEIFASAGTTRLIVARMEVPCCGGLTAIAREAIARSGRKDLELEEAIIGIEDGSITARIASADVT
jgi:NAD-dependent dihydropyrimidine dehydrogenase PreA subunit